MSAAAAAGLAVTAPPAASPAPDRWQRLVVAHRRGPLLVLGGPGTGKTSTLAAAVAARIGEGSEPDRLLVIGANRAAAADLRERIATRLPEAGGAPVVWTWHGFCYAQLRAAATARGAPPPRLLNGPEQDLLLRDLLAGSLAEDTVDWPTGWLDRLGERRLADSLGAAVTRYRRPDIDPLRPDGPAVPPGVGARALGRFYAQYLDVLDALGAVDYPDLVDRAGQLCRDPGHTGVPPGGFDAVYVDDYQDSDPAQQALLAVLAGPGRQLVVFGDPDLCAHRFRGADPEGLLGFAYRFADRAGRPARVVTLRRCWRAGGQLCTVPRRLAWRLPAPGLPAEVLRGHRTPRPAGDPAGRVELHLYPTAAAQAAAVADTLRRAHLLEGVRWSQMAVLVRSADRCGTRLARALTAARVPVSGPGVGPPAAAHPELGPLLTALRLADEPAAVGDQEVLALLGSPLVAGHRSGPSPTAREGSWWPDRVGWRAAVTDPDLRSAVPPELAEPAARAAGLVSAARAVLTAGGGADEAAWAIWTVSGWPDGLRAARDRRGPDRAAAAGALDAARRLFDELERAVDRGGPRRVRSLLDDLQAQRFAAATTDRQPAGRDAVALLTAHRAQGREWDLVVVTGLQEQWWPDLRRADPAGEVEPTADPGARRRRLQDERRLLYLAATRARRRLVLTAVDGTDDLVPRPSRFLAELGLPAHRHPGGGRPLSLTGAVAALRALAVDGSVSGELRRAAAARLAVLAAARDPAGRPVAPAAHPDRWWGLAGFTPGTAAGPAEQPVRLSGTALRRLRDCPLRWFLEHQVATVPAATPRVRAGAVLHALADGVARGARPPHRRALDDELDRVWQLLPRDSAWQAARDRRLAGEQSARFLRWHSAARGRRLLGTEVPFDVTVPAGDRTVRLRGQLDRVEVDRAGRVHVVDLKTSAAAASAADVAVDPQLGCYQTAVAAGALARLTGRPVRVAGAELVQLGVDDHGQPKVARQPALPPGAGWLTDLLADAARTAGADRFPARPGDVCRGCPFRGCCPAQPTGRRVGR